MMAAAAPAFDGAGDGITAGCPRWSRTAWRREQRRATVRCFRIKLQKFLYPDSEEEVQHRLALIAPAIAAGVLGAQVAPLVRRRRNVAAHCFAVSAARIAVVSPSELNRF